MPTDLFSPALLNLTTFILQKTYPLLDHRSAHLTPNKVIDLSLQLCCISKLVHCHKYSNVLGAYRPLMLLQPSLHKER